MDHPLHHPLATEAGSLVLATITYISDRFMPILALALLSRIIAPIATSEHLTAVCKTLALCGASTAVQAYRSLEPRLEEAWYTIVEAPEDAAAWMRKTLGSLVPQVVWEFVARTRSFRLEFGHLLHILGLFVLFFRLAPRTDKKRFERSWALATALYFAVVDWFVFLVSFVAAPEHPIAIFELVKNTVLDALLDLASAVIQPALGDVLSAAWLLLLTASAMLVAAKIVLLAVQSLESSEGLPVGDREMIDFVAAAEQAVSGIEAPIARSPLRIMTAPRPKALSKQYIPLISPRKIQNRISPVRAKSGTILSPAMRKRAPKPRAAGCWSPILQGRYFDFGESRRPATCPSFSMARYGHRRQSLANQKSPMTVDEKLQKVTAASGKMESAPTSPEAFGLARMSGMSPLGPLLEEIDPSTFMDDRKTPPPGTFREV